MGIGDRIPDLSDKELERLQANAVRLKASGSAQQRQQGEELLPLPGAALEEREAAQAETQRMDRRTKKTSP